MLVEVGDKAVPCFLVVSGEVVEAVAPILASATVISARAYGWVLHLNDEVVVAMQVAGWEPSRGSSGSNGSRVAPRTRCDHVAFVD